MNRKQPKSLIIISLFAILVCLVLIFSNRYLAAALSAAAGVAYAAQVILLFQDLGGGRPSGTIPKMIIKVVGLYIIGLLITAVVVVLIMKPNI